MSLTIRNILSSFLANMLIVTGALKRSIKSAQASQSILSLYCHDPSLPFIDRTVKWLLRKGFHFIGIDELSAIAAGSAQFPKGALILTVDDGWRGNKESIVAVAERYKIPITIFVSAEPVLTGNPYWWSVASNARLAGIDIPGVEDLKKIPNEERTKIVESAKRSVSLEREALTLKELCDISESGLVSIQSHTITHPILPMCSDRRARFEVNKSKKIIEGWLGKEVKGFAFPNGDYTERELRYVQESGYQLAFTTNNGQITPENIKDCLSLPRVDLIESVSFSENLCRITGLWFTIKNRLRL